ncbi:MAG: helix-turn-helix domain-containing protein [Microthrixaceae bacterium]
MKPQQIFVIHALRLRGPASARVVADRFSLDEGFVQNSLNALVEEGLARRYEGVLSGWLLTASGRSEGERLLAEQLEVQGLQSTVITFYQQFLVLNPLLLSICTDWQVRLVGEEELLNDHQDTERDASVLRRLDELHSRAVDLLGELTACLDRFEGYSSRLSRAHERIGLGQTEWLTGPSIDSYHTVWFELHEDFLATLGRRRSEDRVHNESAGFTSAGSEE